MAGMFECRKLHAYSAQLPIVRRCANQAQYVKRKPGATHNFNAEHQRRPRALDPATPPSPAAPPCHAAPSSVPPAAEIRHLPIICLTSKASPDDLRSYMSAGMDGCVSKPAESGPLLNTLRAAVPLHLSPSSTVDGRPLAIDATPGRGGGGMKVVQGTGMGVLKGSAACAAEGMALAARRENSVEGALQVPQPYIFLCGAGGVELLKFVPTLWSSSSC